MLLQTQPAETCAPSLNQRHGMLAPGSGAAGPIQQPPGDGVAVPEGEDLVHRAAPRTVGPRPRGTRAARSVCLPRGRAKKSGCPFKNGKLQSARSNCRKQPLKNEPSLETPKFSFLPIGGLEWFWTGSSPPQTTNSGLPDKPKPPKSTAWSFCLGVC